MSPDQVVLRNLELRRRELKDVDCNLYLAGSP